jgi:hypothetical protein
MPYAIARGCWRTRYHRAVISLAITACSRPTTISAPLSCTLPLQPNVRANRADLLKRVFAVDVLICDTCDGSMRILAVLPAGEASRAILEHLGLPTKPPPRTRAPSGRRFDDT